MGDRHVPHGVGGALHESPLDVGPHRAHANFIIVHKHLPLFPLSYFWFWNHLVDVHEHK